MTHERPRALERCLGSIDRLETPEGGFEVIVVDDGSERRPARPPEADHPDLDLRYEWAPHAGVAAARNRGARRARGDFVAFLADDYTLPPDYLLQAGRWFDRYPRAGVVTFNVRTVARGPARHVQQLYHDLVLLQNAGAAPDENGVIETSTLPASRAAVFRREVLERVGPFDERLEVGEDGEMGHRLADAGIPLLFVPEYYVDHHEGKGLLDFLRQRRSYAASYHRLAGRKRPPAERPSWTLARCARAVGEKLRAWVPVSRRSGRFARFCLLWPGLALFLSAFYLTLRECDRAERRRARGPLTRLRLALHAATRPAPARRATMAAIEGFTRVAARVLCAGGVASAVFARGSLATGGFRPFLSDVDLAIAVPRGRRSRWETCRALHRRLRVARVIQPFARDRWQTILPESQWGLVERYGDLFGVDAWRPIAGEAPWSGAGRSDDRLRLAAKWNRQHLWTVLAQRQAQAGERGPRELEASLRKARAFRAAIAGRVGRSAPDAPASVERAVVELEESAGWIHAALEPEALPGTQAAEPTDDAREAESRALSVLAEGIDLDRDAVAVVATEGVLHLVARRDAALEGWAAATARAYGESGVHVFVHLETAFAFAPLLGPRRIAWARPGARLPAWPRLLEEQWLYESLYQATHLWVCAGARDPAAALEPHVRNAVELCAFFRTGEPRRGAPPLPDALDELRGLDEILAERLPALPSRPDAETLFEIGATVTDRLAGILETGRPRVPAPAGSAP